MPHDITAKELNELSAQEANNITRRNRLVKIISDKAQSEGADELDMLANKAIEDRVLLVADDDCKSKILKVII